MNSTIQNKQQNEKKKPLMLKCFTTFQGLYEAILQVIKSGFTAS